MEALEHKEFHPFVVKEYDNFLYIHNNENNTNCCFIVDKNHKELMYMIAKEMNDVAWQYFNLAFGQQ